jgi:site-specific DNA recombinase
MMVAHANLSSRDASRRIRRAKRADAEAGKPHRGVRAFGYAPDGVSIVEAEAELIRDACARLLAGATGYSIVADWNARGIRTARGKVWRYLALRQVVTNPRNAGLASHHVRSWDPVTQQEKANRWEVLRRADGSEVVGVWPAIVERGTWEAVCQVYADTAERARARGAGRNTRRHLLSGLLRCGVCGGGMYGQVTVRGVHVYRCLGKGVGACGPLSRAGAPLDAYVSEAVLAKYEEELAGYVTAAPAPAQWSGAADLARVERKLGEAYAAWKADQLPAGEYFATRADLEGDRDRLRAEHAAWTGQRAARDPGQAGVDVRAAWNTPEDQGGWTVVAKREFLSRQLLAIEVLERPADPVTGKRGRKFDPRLIRPVWRAEPLPGRPAEHDHPIADGDGPAGRDGVAGAAVAA